jgi:NADH:ubiquinone oxidoreductase subunit H
MYAAPEIVGTCLTCIAPSSFGATLALILVGVLFAVHAERRKLAPVKTRPTPSNSN